MSSTAPRPASPSTGDRRLNSLPGRLPPGQHVSDDFPVVSASAVPVSEPQPWVFSIEGAVERESTWSWDELLWLPAETVTTDVHCVTGWSKLDTVWTGVSLDTLLGEVTTDAEFAMAWCEGGYAASMPLADLRGGKAWLVYALDGKPLTRERGGPARLLVPQLYFWKSAKWVRRVELTERDTAGYWEGYGYHDRGDPWLEQRLAA